VSAAPAESRASSIRGLVLEYAMFVLLDVAVVWLATILAYWTRFGGEVGGYFLGNAATLALAASALFPLLFWASKLYQQVWRYVSVDMIARLGLAVAIGFGILLAWILLSTETTPLAISTRRVPVGVLVITATFIFVGAALWRSFGRIYAFFQRAEGIGAMKRTIIVGAGDAGSLLLRDIEGQPDLGLRVVGFIDDDRRKVGRIVRGVKVFGAVDELAEIVKSERIDEILVAMPSANAAQRRSVLDACTAAGVPTRIIGSLAREASSVGVADLRTVSVEDLLGRDPVPIDVEQVASTIAGKIVAVTGAAGSIGSELCRQVMRLRPKRLMLIEIDESRTYETYLELARADATIPEMHLCDVRDSRKLAALFAAERPDIVLHAAAYKHVPLMELAPDEAVKANIGGTRNVIEACETAGVGHFVLISTDKAVQPSSVMGATKTVAEMLTIDAARRGRIRASAVRFGNVLASRGSVIPLFEEQLRRGGPLLVTHPDVTRYFMTIPEAARLVLQAQAISDGGEIFVLEMGEPVRIVDLARKMITLSGIDTHIEFIGLRPGEKLHEVLVYSHEDLLPTGREKITRVNALQRTPADFPERIEEMLRDAGEGDLGAVRAGLHALLPSYITADAEGIQH
jgi:FlaA1/EpsC-like NDP-sugar epimerase